MHFGVSNSVVIPAGNRWYNNEKWTDHSGFSFLPSMTVCLYRFYLSVSPSLSISLSPSFFCSLSLSIYSILFCSNLTQSNPIYLSLSLRLSVRLSVHLSVCLFISLFFHLSTYHYLSPIYLPYISIYQNHIYIYITDCVLYLSIFFLLSYPNWMMLLQPQSPDKGA